MSTTHTGKIMTKTELRAWLKRINENTRYINAILKVSNVADHLDDIEEAANDISGAAAQIVTDLRGEEA